MALGWCGVCDTLRSIRPGAQKWGSRERDWYPVPHEIPVHQKCGNIVDDSNCRKCGPVDDVIVMDDCPGDKKAIK